jgi:hypothetical protein
MVESLVIDHVERLPQTDYDFSIVMRIEEIATWHHLTEGNDQ